MSSSFLYTAELIIMSSCHQTEKPVFCRGWKGSTRVVFSKNLSDLSSVTLNVHAADSVSTGVLDVITGYYQNMVYDRKSPNNKWIHNAVNKNTLHKE